MDDNLTQPSDLHDLAAPPFLWSEWVLDQSALDGIREIQAPGQADLLTEMVEAFLGDAPVQVAQIIDALVRSDAETVAGAAHALKSGAGYLGAKELQRLCIEMENLGRSGSVDGAQVMAEPLQIAFEQTRRALREEIGGQDSPA